jgi:L-fuconolactonase
MRLDAHQHFWHYSPTGHGWMTDQMSVLKHDFLPQDLQPLLASLGFDGCVAVQARQSLEETRWLLALAAEHPFIKAVVGWVDLRSPQLSEQLQTFSTQRKFAGVRHVIHDEADDDFMLAPEFRRGIGQLHALNLTYDLLLYPRHLRAAAKLVDEFPGQLFVLDHLAKPNIAEEQFSPWREDLQQLAKFPNVYCKLSGLVTEAHWQQWQSSDFDRYLEIALGAFGWGRLMIGSDWPVCTLSGEYPAVMHLVLNFVKKLSPQAQAAILGENCARFYRIPAEAAQPQFASQEGAVNRG